MNVAAAHKPRRLGWIGLGRMGAPMAANLLAAGWPVTVYNRSQAKAQDLVVKGASSALSVADLAHNCDVVFSMIQDDAALAEIAQGTGGGVLGNLAPGSVFIDMSTVSPKVSAAVAEEAARRSIAYLRAPVSGSTANATAGLLTVFASGPQQTFEECLNLLETIGRKVFYVGGSEQARYLKLAINLMAGATAVLVAEALVLGEKGGVDWEQMIDIINSSAVASPILGYKAQQLKTRDFTPMFTATQMAKDFDFVLDVAKEVQAPLAMAAFVRQQWSAMQGSGRGEFDCFGYVDFLESISGVSGRSLSKSTE